MEKSKVESFTTSKSGMFSSRDIMNIYERLENMPDESYITIRSLSYKNPNATLAMAILGLGFVGLDAFYAGKTWFGLAKLALATVYSCILIKIASIGFNIISIIDYDGVDLYILLFAITIETIVLLILKIVSMICARKWTYEYNYELFAFATRKQQKSNEE